MEENHNKMQEDLKKNKYMLFKLSLAIEDYQDNTGENNELVNKIFQEHDNLRKELKEKNIGEQLEMTSKLLKQYNEILDVIGRDNFIFYDDGDINYIWEGNGKNEQR